MLVPNPFLKPSTDVRLEVADRFAIQKDQGVVSVSPSFRICELVGERTGFSLQMLIQVRDQSGPVLAYSPLDLSIVAHAVRNSAEERKRLSQVFGVMRSTFSGSVGRCVTTIGYTSHYTARTPPTSRP
jgi:hypothetical protein